jgi:hypothetical protein
MCRWRFEFETLGVTTTPGASYSRSDCVHVRHFIWFEPFLELYKLCVSKCLSFNSYYISDACKIAAYITLFSSSSSIPVLGLMTCYCLKPSSLRSSWLSSSNGSYRNICFGILALSIIFTCCNKICLWLLTYSVIGVISFYLKCVCRPYVQIEGNLQLFS